MDDNTSGYGWIIDIDHLFLMYGSDEDSVFDRTDAGTIGPRNISDEMMQRLKNGEGTKFRLYDDDRILYYSGRYIGDLDEGDPLTDFGGPNAGAVYMSEFVNGKWEITLD